MKQIKSVQEVADWRLCLGCGACAYICPKDQIRLVDFFKEGVRPVVDATACGSCTQCLDVCPSYENDHRGILGRTGTIDSLKPYVGPVLDIWEGHAVDAQIRSAGSSGGILTALSLYCLEREGMHGVLHIGQDPDDPLRNKTALSTSREELMGRTGSRYAPASACDRLDLIENAPAPCVFIGQPTEVSAVQKARALRPQLDENVGLTLSFFCAGSPPREGTIQLLKSMGVDPDEVQSLRYRGNGWPGNFAVTMKGQTEPSHFRTYKDSWGFVQAYRPFSVHLCPDGTGEDADISCGDPWYREVKAGEPGSSLVVVRTERGRRILQGAIDAGYLELTPSDADKLLRSQEGLFEKRGAIWGRIATLRMFGLPAPKLWGFSLFKNWLNLSLEDKLRSTFGTARRILKRKYFKPLRLDPTAETPAINGHRIGENKNKASGTRLAITENPSILVTIASYGTAQDHFLRKVIEEYRKLSTQVRIIVLSNQAKEVDGAEVVVGLPSRDPYSLPFAHKEVMAKNADGYDLFVYSEDDVLITEENVRTFLRAQEKLEGDEIPGFIRSESDPSGQRFITSINYHFRWLPGSVVERGGDLFAELSNQHSGCFMVTRAQLKTAIASGGFLVAPHAERYGMLETAASDLYTQCGLKRLVSLSRIHDFIVPHLPNKYYTKMGVPLEVLEEQVRALCEIHKGKGWSGALFEPETRAPSFRWSKALYEKPDLELLSTIPTSAKSILTVGGGWGGNEAHLKQRGANVSAIPLDGVFAAMVRQRGIHALDGPFEAAIEGLGGQRFDAILIPDALHLVSDPIAWLARVSKFLSPNGKLSASVPHTTDLITRVKNRLKHRTSSLRAVSGQSGLRPVNARILRNWFRAAGFDEVQIASTLEGSRLALRKWSFKALEPLFASRFIVTAVPKASV
jgi:coenzyme F420 hydrogenase subunit beta